MMAPKLSSLPPAVFGMALPGSAGAGDAAANDLQRSPALASIQELAIASDFTVFMAPEVPTETRRLALRQLWRLFGWESDGLGDYEAIETVRPGAAADDPVSAKREASKRPRLADLSKAADREEPDDSMAGPKLRVDHPVAAG